MALDLFESLKSIPEFNSVPENQIRWLATKGNITILKDGDHAFKPGSQIDEMRIVLKGEIDFYLEQSGNMRLFDTIEEKEITGLLPYSRMKGSTAYGVVRGEVALYSLHKDHFPEMIRDHYELTAVLVHTMTDRVRYSMKQQQLNDKMMSLGKLSAGLAHELNNPSAAVVRGAHELKRHLGNIPQKFKSVIKIKATDEQVDQVNDLVFRKIESAKKLKLSLSEKTAREDEIIEWLENNQIDDAYTMGETFAEYDMRSHDLEELKAVLRPEDRSAVINWISQVLTTERLVDEIEEASKRINALVTSIKSYTHMDRAPERERADIHDGIRNTLTMLNHKIRRNQVRVVENFQENIPQPLIYISAMNQVWTNIIDNAIDALEGRPQPTLEISTTQDREFIVISIIDNGPGVPAEIQDKIFDSFFTTKPVGKGTGLGLEIARQIVNQHHGRIALRSVPGRTEFEVCIPIG